MSILKVAFWKDQGFHRWNEDVFVRMGSFGFVSGLEVGVLIIRGLLD